MNIRLLTSLCLLHLSLVLACQRSDSSSPPSQEWLISEVERLNATDNGEKALALLSEIAEGTRNSLGGQSSEYAAILSKIGQQYTFLRNYIKADSIFTVSEHVLSQDTSKSWLLSATYHFHGQSLILSCDYAKAETVFKEALHREISRAPSDSTTLMRPLLDLGTLYFIKSDYPNAIVYLEPWRALYVAMNHPLDSVYLSECGNLTLSYVATKEYEKLVRLADEILAVLDSTSQKYSSFALKISVAAGYGYQQLGENTRAKSAYSRAVVTAQELGDTLSADYRGVIWKFGTSLVATESYEDAIMYFEKSLRLTELLDGIDSDEYRNRARVMADFYRKVGNVERAIELDSVASRSKPLRF